MKVYVIYSDYDYSPVVIASDKHGVVFQGDNIHDADYKTFAKGYAKGISYAYDEDIQMTPIGINTKEDLDTHEGLLHELGYYETFKSELGF